MNPRTSYVSITDQFCGAGGSSIGATQLAGVELKLAINHWKLAIDTHNSNFPDAAHVLTDLHTANPLRYPATDILITSPECKNHSLAKGKKRRAPGQLDLWGNGGYDPSEERSRATMWCVVNWAEDHRYNIIVTENVVDIFRWPLFADWLRAMHTLGYRHECVFYNSMYAHPTPQSRDRIYIVFWRKGNRKPDLRFTPRAWCSHCGADVAAVQVWKNSSKRWGRYGAHGQYWYRCPTCAAIVEPYYYCAANAIDWSLRGERIGDKQQGKRPLSEKTLERIRYGLQKYGYQSFLDKAYTPRGKPSQALATRDPLGSITTLDHHQLIQPPFTVPTQRSHGHSHRARAIDEALFTQTAQQDQALITGPRPFLVSLNYFSPRNRGVEEPMPTQTTKQPYGLVVSNYNGPTRHAVRPTDEALPCMAVGSGVNNHSLVVPPFLIHQNRSRLSCEAIDEPMRTQTGSLEHSLIVPSGGTWSEEAKPATEPYPTQTAHESYGVAMIVPERSHATGHDVREDAAPTVCAAGNHHAFVYTYQNDRLSEMHESMPTVTTIERSSVVEVDVDDCYFRMLQPHEIQAAMAFPADYTVLGTQREKVRQLGNAVTPPVMSMILERCIETLA